MLVSYITGVRFQGVEHFKDRMPSIFEIQDFIEAAWDQGINAKGRIETGGVRETRKFIGTPEAQAVFTSLQIPYVHKFFFSATSIQREGDDSPEGSIVVTAMKDKEPGKSESRLYKDICKYFESAVVDPTAKVHATNLPPIYFQHIGHSLTIIGIERQKAGGINLLVFDPMFHDANPLSKLVGKKFKAQGRDTEKLLRPYRRGNHYLKKFREFEILKYVSSPASPCVTPAKAY